MTGFPTYGITPANGSLDTSFEQGSGFNNQVERVLETSNSYKFMGGYLRFTGWNGLFSYGANKTNTLMRLNKTYYIPDSNMLTGANFNGFGSGLRKIISGGGFIYCTSGHTEYNGVLSKHITKLNESDLSIAVANTGVGFSNPVGEAYFANGLVFFSASSATTYNGGSSSILQVINTDLTSQTTLTSFFNPNNTVSCVFEQADGKVVISGAFTSIGGTTQNRIVRYNTDWTVDTTFTTNVGTGPNSGAIDIKQLSDGKLVLGGAFTSFNGTSTQRIIVLNTDGTIATAVASGFSSGQVNSLTVDGSNNIYCGGTFTSYAGNTRQRLVKLSSTLVIDATFVCDCSATVQTILLDGYNLFVSGQFTTAKSETVGGIVVVSDTTGDIVDKLYGGFSNTQDIIIMIQTTNFIYIHNSIFGNIFGGINTFGSKLVKDIVEIDDTGLFLNSYDKIGQGQITSYAINGNDEYYSGSFPDYNGIVTKIVKFESGIFNSSFVFNNQDVNKILYDNGGLIVGGTFTSPTNRIVKLLPDGTVDATFDVGTGLNNRCFDVIKLSNGLYMIVGTFSTYKSVACNNIITVDSVGNKDNTFVGGNFAGGSTGPRRMLQLSNGNILVYGSITQYKSVACNRAIILDSVGDQVAWLSSNFNGTPNRAVEHNGKVYFTGSFTTFGATTVNRIACIDLATGALVNIFGTGLNGTGNDLIIDSEGKLVVVGNFTTYNDNPVGYVARIFI